MSENSFDKFQSKSFDKDYFETMDQERVHSINRIAPDSYLDQWESLPAIHKKSSLMQMVLAQVKETNSFDIAIHIDDDVFNCFMLILQSYSKFFQTRSCHEKIIKLSSLQITPSVFHKIYEWMLKSSKMIERDGLIPLLMGAQYLKVELLEQQIWNLVQDGVKFQECEAFLLYLEAKNWNCEKIKTMMMNRVQRFFMTVVCTEEFLLMEPDEIQNWLKLDTIAVNSEVDVFFSAARWLLHDWDERQKYLMELMQHVRFGLFPPWRIVEYQRNRNMGKLSPIMDNIELQKTLKSSLPYSVHLNNFEADSEQFADFLTRFGFKRLRHRELLGQPWQLEVTDSTYTFEQFEGSHLNTLKTNAFANWKKNFK